MSVVRFDCQQSSPEWYAARLGIPTASEFATILAKGRSGGDSKTRRTYMLKLIGERITGTPMWNYQNEHMERGKTDEEDARNAYCFLRDTEVERCGFLKNDGLLGRAGESVGCSPDGLIGKEGMFEAKSRLAHLQCEILLTPDVLPPEHVAQCQGALWVAEREWLDFVSHCPGMPLFVLRVYRDEPYIKQLAHAVDIFVNELHTVMDAVKGYQRPKAAA